MCNLNRDDASRFVAVGFAVVSLVEWVEDGVQLVSKGAASNLLKIEVEVIQQEMDSNCGMASLRAQRRCRT